MGTSEWIRSGKRPAPQSWTDGSAIVLFGGFILFSVWLFRKSDIPLKANRSRDKRRRDDVCLACGIIMIVSVLWALSSMITKASIFWPEAIAIAACACSWLVKGEAYQPVRRAIRRVMPRRGTR